MFLFFLIPTFFQFVISACSHCSLHVISIRLNLCRSLFVWLKCFGKQFHYTYNNNMYLNFPFVSHGIPKAFVSHAIPSAGNPDSTNQRTWKSLKFPALLSADPEGARWVESSLDKESKLRGQKHGCWWVANCRDHSITHFMRIKHGKWMVILTGFPCNSALFGLVVYIYIYSDPCNWGKFCENSKWRSSQGEFVQRQFQIGIAVMGQHVFEKV